MKLLRLQCTALSVQYIDVRCVAELKCGYNDSRRPFLVDKREKSSVNTGVEKWALSGACLIELDKAK